MAAGAIPAGWSSLEARQSHDLKVGGSNPSPAIHLTKNEQAFWEQIG